MKLIPKRKLVPEEVPPGMGGVANYLSEIISYITQYNNTFNTGSFIGSLDDILDGITYGKVLNTNLSSNALKIITAQTALLDLLPATDNTSDLGSSTKEFALGYIKKAYADTRLRIPVGANMYD